MLLQIEAEPQPATRTGPPPLPERVIAIMAYARGGSGLWASLFDSHPDVLMFPDCVIMNFFRFWERFGTAPAGAVAEAFVDHYSVAFDARRSNPEHLARLDYGSYLGLCDMGPNRDEHIEVNVGRFMASLRQYLDFEAPTSRKRFLQAVHVAYAEAQGRAVTDDAVIVFGLHVRLYNDFQRLLDDFPASVIMQTVRHPVRGLGSWFRHFAKTGAVHPELILSGLDMVLRHGRPELAEQRARWFVVRLEDVHQRPRETMQRVAGWLGLSWNETLLQSTFNGKQWWNERNSPQVSGFSTEIIGQRFEELIPPRDFERLSRVLQARAEQWGYVPPRPRTWASRLRAAAGVIPLLQIDRLCLETVAVADDARGLKRMRLYHYLPIYWRARRLLFAAIFGPDRPEAPVISETVGPEPSMTGRELLLVGGAVGGVDDSFFREAFRRGRVELQSGRLDRAIRFLSAGIKAQPNVIEPYRYRAMAYERMRRLTEANADRACCNLPPLPVPPGADSPEAAALRAEIDAILREERQANPVSYNADGPYQGYDRIGIVGQRASVEERVRQLDLVRYLGPDSRLLDIGSNAGFLVAELALSCAIAHGVEPNEHLNRVGMATAGYLGVSHKVHLFDTTFMTFEAPHPYDLVLCLAAFYTSDGRERADADPYFAKIASMLADGGRLVYESTGYAYEPAAVNPFGHASQLASASAVMAISRHLTIEADEEVVVQQRPRVLRRLVVARKDPGTQRA